MLAPEPPDLYLLEIPLSFRCRARKWTDHHPFSAQFTLLFRDKPRRQIAMI